MEYAMIPFAEVDFQDLSIIQERDRLLEEKVELLAALKEALVGLRSSGMDAAYMSKTISLVRNAIAKAETV